MSISITPTLTFVFQTELFLSALHHSKPERICLFVIFICILVGNSACGGTGVEAIEESRNSKISSQTQEMEIVPLFDVVPSTIAEDKVLPNDPDELRTYILKSTKTESAQDLLPLLDVVLLYNSDDLEMREVRGNLLLKEGAAEDASADFIVCCKGGRETCCH